MNTTTLKNSAPSQGWMHKTGGMIPGLLLAGAIAAVATWAAQRGTDPHTAVMLAIAGWLALASMGFRWLPVSPLVAAKNP